MKALVMGGGMSGLAAAVNLLEQGLEVEIIDADEIFGGRANSWLDKDGDMIDNALHVFMSYYLNLMNFFKKLGVYDKLKWVTPEFHLPQKDGPMCYMRFNNMPAPFHVAASLMGMLDYKVQPLWKMACSAPTMIGLLGKSKADMDAMDEVSWGEYRYRRAPFGSFKYFDPAAHGLTFTEPYALSAKVMANWITKIFAGPEYSKIAFADGGLGEIWVGSCLDYIQKKGGKFETKKAVTAINMKDGKISEVIVNGKEKRTADIYVSAMTPWALRKVIPQECFKYDYFKDVCYFENAPSLSVQIWYDKMITNPDDENLFLTSDCSFNCSADLARLIPRVFTGGSMMELVVSPADHWRHMPDDVVFEQCNADIKARFPEARTAKVKKYVVVRERQGVYRANPGMEKHRPYQRSPFTNLYLTGDWTKTHVSSGGMEAAIWTANHCTELIMADKFNKKISLNVEFEPKGPFLFLYPFIKYMGPAIAAVFGWAAVKLIRRF
jgi:uncharacterized protein with NAD-binding domain and iron-sulfur cluster